MDFFKDLEDIRSSFRKFAALLPADGALVINGDIPDYEEITKDLKCRVITFGSSSSFDYYPENITHDDFAHPDFYLHGNLSSDGENAECVREFDLGVCGDHNISNAMASVAVADLLGIDTACTRRALKSYAGTDRRFEYKGNAHGITIIDDYAHHPSEIRATLATARQCPHRTLWCVFQPHTYSRTKTFMDDFAQALCLADRVVLADIYAARETDTLGISSATLQEKIKELGHPCEYFSSFEEIEDFLMKNCTKGDLLITMGAGDVDKIGIHMLSK